MKYRYAHPDFFDGVPRPDFASLSGKLVIYGAGFQGLLAAFLLKKQGIKVLCFGDQDIKKQGTIYYKLPVYSPEEMKERYPEAIPIVTPYNLRPAFEYVQNELGYENAVTPFSLFLEFDSAEFDSLREIPEWYHPESLSFHMDMFYRKCLNVHLDKSFLSLDICVSEVCNLRCKNCTSLMPCYSAPKHFDLEDVLRDITTILSGREFHHISIEGGETFLWKPLPQLLRSLSKLPNLMEIIVITNGTILPSNELLEALCDFKVTIQLSDYGTISKKEKLMEVLKQYHVRYWVYSQKWYNLSAFHKDEITGKTLEHITKGCCKLGGNGDPYLIDGQLYRCPIQAHLHRLGIFQSDSADYVDLRQPDFVKVQKEIAEFINVKSPPKIVKLCRHCNGRGYAGVEVPPAEQLAAGEQIQVRFE